MEFFAEIPVPEPDRDKLVAALPISRMAELCESITSVLKDEGDTGEIYCVWGQFKVRRGELVDGVRFTLPHCPNALSWTITTDDEEELVVVHCTINKRSHDADFIDSLEEFVADWERGLRKILPVA